MDVNKEVMLYVIVKIKKIQKSGLGIEGGGVGRTRLGGGGSGWI